MESLGTGAQRGKGSFLAFGLLPFYPFTLLPLKSLFTFFPLQACNTLRRLAGGNRCRNPQSLELR